MPKLNEEARQHLEVAEISVAAWARRHSGSSAWSGDKCGCPDGRCIGYHHEVSEPCQCLPTLIRAYETEQQANVEAKEIWDEYQSGRDNNDAAAVAHALKQAEQWVNTYEGVSVTSWSLDEVVDGRAGISVTNSINDQRWLVWAADSAA
ncbi:hypothetical protein [Brevibacterium oceani]|uniref:hypothetical protein n=1 Tax=Brevibacterium oceani TaxID=358099 RepID=UPI0015E6F158|nr:hypothetical protein [Brevibacterium oceani]WGP08110.1 hypothetical protein QFE97_19045 [Bacillus subtilis]